MGITAYTIKSLIGRITDKKYLTGINKEATNGVAFGKISQMISITKRHLPPTNM
jgi:hypothetical protein